MICIVDDEDVVRNSLLYLCRSRGLEAHGFTNGYSLLNAFDEGTETSRVPTCVVLDVRMPSTSGLEVFGMLKERSLAPPVSVIFLTGHGDIPMAVQMLKEGAFDFCEKPFSDNNLVDRILAAEDRSRQLLDQQEHHYSRTSIRDRALASLSSREKQVMEEIIRGKLNKVIASDLGIGVRTVEQHRASIFQKMTVRSAVELALLVRSA